MDAAAELTGGDGKGGAENETGGGGMGKGINLPGGGTLGAGGVKEKASGVVVSGNKREGELVTTELSTTLFGPPARMPCILGGRCICVYLWRFWRSLRSLLIEPRLCHRSQSPP